MSHDRHDQSCSQWRTSAPHHARSERRPDARELDTQLRARAAAEQVSPSALVRRLLRDALRGGAATVLTVEQVEQIARRVLRESI
ncbi:MAG: hypothetical protein ACRDRS_16975 [Pseudonocardiaceae bacterium]